MLTICVLTTGCDPQIVSPEFKADDKPCKDGAYPGLPQVLASGLKGAQGSAIGPGGDLYVTEGAIGRISRIDRRTGEVSTFASGLPPWVLGFGGVMDIAFYGHTAYALVTVVGPDLGMDDVVGIYRIDGPEDHTVIADIGAWASAPENEPSIDYDLPSGVQYSMQPYKGGFLVTDGNHNRVLFVTRKGKISEVKAFGNIVPTGLEVHGSNILMAQAGPAPHAPEDGKVVAFSSFTSSVLELASGAPLLVDVEYGHGKTLYALSQGAGSSDIPGSPAIDNDGSLLKVNADGTFTTIATGIDRPTSMEFMGDTAYVVTMAGEVIVVENVRCATDKQGL